MSAKTARKRTTKKAAKATTPMNLFQKAAVKEKDEPKKPKGTVFTLPVDLDAGGTLTEECQRLHDSIGDIKTATADEKAAKNLGNLAKGLLGKHALDSYVDEFATLSVLPPGPVTLVNHEGVGVTYVIQDKSGQNSLDEKQVGKLTALLGKRVANAVLTESETFSFCSTTLAEKAAGETAADGETVANIVFGIVSDAIMGSTKLTIDQKAALIKKKTATHLKKNTLQRVPELLGSNPTKIKAFFEAVGSAIVRYIKA
jgi:hypothetical protein